MEFVRDAGNPMTIAPVRESKVPVRSVQVNVLDKFNRLWHYLANVSTEEKRWLSIPNIRGQIQRKVYTKLPWPFPMTFVIGFTT